MRFSQNREFQLFFEPLFWQFETSDARGTCRSNRYSAHLGKMYLFATIYLRNGLEGCQPNKHALDIMKQWIPNKVVTIRPSDPSWMTSCIRKLIRKRKRAYRKAKKMNAPNDRIIFKRLRNETTSMIRDSKKAMNDSLAAKLKSDTLSSKQCCFLLKSFISPSFQSSNHPLEKDGLVYTDEKEKANLLNDFFRA